MKSRLLTILLLSALWSWGQVLNTETFSLQNVATEVGYNNLLDCFTNSNAAYFNPTYGSKTMNPKTLLGFRDYGSHNYIVPCPVVGDLFQGGTVAYLFQSGDPEYVDGFCSGIIAVNLSSSTSYVWGLNLYTGAISPTDGELNTVLINQAHGTTEMFAARLCANFSVSDNGVLYSDFYLPAPNEVSKIRPILGRFGDGFWWTSQERTSSTANYTADGYSIYYTSKSSTFKVVAIRKFAIQL